MKEINKQIRRIVTQVTKTKNDLEKFAQSKDWVKDARAFAEKKSQMVQKTVVPKAKRVRTLIDREVHEINKFGKRVKKTVQRVVGARKRARSVPVTPVKTAHKSTKKTSRSTG